MRNTPNPKIAKLGTVETVPIDRIRPYWRNPRKVTDQAVNAVAQSMSFYGYQQPIVVDSDYVIVVGHTRYAALRRNGISEVPVIVASKLTPAQIKQYRLIDNKTGEFSSWDFNLLASELESMDSSISSQFFTEVDQSDLDRIMEDDDRLREEWGNVRTDVPFTCPSCYHSWEMEVTREMVLSGTLRVETDEEQ